MAHGPSFSAPDTGLVAPVAVARGRSDPTRVVSEVLGAFNTDPKRDTPVATAIADNPVSWRTALTAFAAAQTAREIGEPAQLRGMTREQRVAATQEYQNRERRKRARAYTGLMTAAPLSEATQNRIQSAMGNQRADGLPDPRLLLDADGPGGGGGGGGGGSQNGAYSMQSMRGQHGKGPVMAGVAMTV